MELTAVYRIAAASVLDGMVGLTSATSGFHATAYTRQLTLNAMRMTLAQIGTRGQRTGAKSGNAKAGYEALTAMYVERVQPYQAMRCEPFASEAEMLAWLARQSGRTRATLVLADARGRQMTSEEFAAWLGARRDSGAQQVVIAIGPADGWTDAARSEAELLLSFGKMTLAHELARLVAAEQIYRACTILAGHPYHAGH